MRPAIMRTAIVAVVTFVSLALLTVLALGALEFFTSDPDAMIARAVTRIAEIEVQIDLRDQQIDFRDVAYRPVDPTQRRSTAEYVCGFYRQRGGGAWQRFIWFRTSRDEKSTIIRASQIGGEVMIAGICPR